MRARWWTAAAAGLCLACAGRSARTVSEDAGGSSGASGSRAGSPGARSGTGGSGGSGGIESCPGYAADDCMDCSFEFVEGECVDDHFVCPNFHCPPEPEPDQGLVAACDAFCSSWATSCLVEAPAEDVCNADCVHGYTGARPDCTSEVVPYLYCAGVPDDCSNDGSTNPLRCSSELFALLDCANAHAPFPTCDFETATAGFNGCTHGFFCASHDYEVACDAEDDGSGTSLCDCTRDGAFSGSTSVMGIGAVACAGAVAACVSD